MKIFVDENIPISTVEELRQMGHDVLDIRGTDKEGLSDESIWELVIDQKRMIITTDKGFSQYRDELHEGIIIIRLKQPNRKKIHSGIFQVFRAYNENEWKGLMVIVRDTVQTIWRSRGESLFQ